MDARAPETRLRQAAADAGVASNRVLDAVERVPRDWFVPDGERGSAHVDEPLFIGHGQTTSQPSLIARILEDACIAPGSSVLEVGTGFGYQAALATLLASPGGSVVTIERDARLAAEAHERLARLAELMGDTPWDVQVRVGDGALGAPELAPFDAILVAAACDDVPPTLIEQLAEGGRLLAPVERREGTRLLRYERVGDTVQQTGSLGLVRYVPLRRGITGERPPIGRNLSNTLHVPSDTRA